MTRAAVRPPAPRAAVADRVLAAGLATFFVAIQFYTSLAALAPTPPVGFVFLGRAGAAVLVAALIAGAAIAAVRLGRGPYPAPSLRLLSLWIGALVVASVLGLDPSSGLQIAGMMLLGAAFHLALVRFYARPPVARYVVRAYLATGALAALAGIVMTVLKRPAELYGLNHGRAAGPFVTANQFAAFLVVYGFIAAGAALATRDRWFRLLATLATGVAVVALALTFSRAAWIGGALGALGYALALAQRRVAVALGIALTLALAVALARPVAGHNPAENFNRVATLEGGVRVAELFPLTGAGPMAYWRVFPAVRPPSGGAPGSFEALHPHNAVVSLLGELGVLGTLAVAGGWIVFGRAVRRRLRGADDRRRAFTLAIVFALVALLVQGMADLVGTVLLTFVWIPFAALGLAAADHGLAE